MKRFGFLLVLSTLVAHESYAMTCRGTCKIRVPGGSYEEDVYRDITKPKTWDEKVTIKYKAYDETRAVTMPGVPDDVKSLGEARPHMDNFCASHFKNYTGMSSVVSCDFPPSEAEIKEQKRIQKEWDAAEKKEQARQDAERKVQEAKDLKYAQEAAEAEKRLAANVDKLILSLGSKAKCPAGEVAVKINNPQRVKLGKQSANAYQGCVKKVGNDLVMSSGVVRIHDNVYAQVSNGQMNGKALGTRNEAGTSLTYANGKVVKGTYSKRDWYNDGNYRGQQKELKIHNGDDTTRKILRYNNPEDENSGEYLSRLEKLKKDKLISLQDYHPDGDLGSQVEWNSKGEKFAQIDTNVHFYDYSCTSRPNYTDKKSMYDHCVDEDYSSVSNIFKKLEDKYPEMKKVQSRLRTTFHIRYDPKAKCIMKSASNKVSVKFNPDKEYTDPQYNYTVDKTYQLSSKDDDEIYTAIVAGKGLRDACATIATTPRSKSMAQYGALKKAVYCPEAPKELAGDVIAD